MNKRMKIEGMSCGHCQMRVKKTLEKMDGVEKVEVNLQEGFADIEDTKGLDEEVLKEAISMAGYEVVSIESL